ncbi:MAG: ribose-phosphate diphosphokinase [Candidatus Aenigmarchaeota archaeon]|nr:ribose-phosphate diphosphokinase [Candidatus Aenigmarchaeota archaeon]
MLIVPDSYSSGLAGKLSDISGIKISAPTIRRFPDAETYVRVGAVNGHDIVLVAQLYPGQNGRITELLLLADALHDAGAKSIAAVIPYLPYARQDKRFQDGEALSMKTVAKLLLSVGVTGLLCVDLHFHKKPETFDFHGVKCTNISAGKLLLDHVRSVYPGIEAIGPDLGSSEMIANATGKKAVMEKVKICTNCGKRQSECACKGKDITYKVVTLKSDIEVRGKNVMILDDIISSGTTMLAAVDKLKESGAKKMIIGATHGLFLNNSLESLKAKADYLVVTDSVETACSKVSLAPLIAGSLKGLFKTH